MCLLSLSYPLISGVTIIILFFNQKVLPIDIKNSTIFVVNLAKKKKTDFPNF